jgi:predicted MPP superfamily phosphohydrolase
MFSLWQNNSITITECDYINSKIPDGFNEFKIAHISDLHNKRFGKNQVNILTKLENLTPNIIVITGDLIDRRKYDLDKSMAFVEGAINIAPIFYV